MADYNLQIITPNGKIFDGKASSINAPGQEGRFSVLAGHAPMIAKIVKGTLKITTDGVEKNLSVSDGIVEVNSEHQVLVLSSAAQFD